MLMTWNFLGLFLSFLILTIALLLHSGLSFYVYPFVVAIYGGGVLLAALNKRKLAFGLLLFVFVVVLSAQVASLYNSGSLVSSLLLMNLGETTSVDDRVILTSALVITSYFFCVFIFLIYRPMRVMVSKKIYLPVLFLYVGLEVYGCFLPSAGVFPIWAFGKALHQCLKEMSYQPTEREVLVQKVLYGKDFVYQNSDDESVPDLRNKNIVVLFTEGFTFNIIDKFSGYSLLTPNLSRLMDKSLWFDNYFNHTAATYRGLRGQMSSSYQLKGGLWYGVSEVGALENKLKSPIVNLSSILQDNGYHTYFLSAHKRDDNLNRYLETFGFDKVFTAADFKKDEGELSDKELFEGLYRLMVSGELKEPYFIGIYNLGTHLGQKSPDAFYTQNGEEINDLLSVIHNFDIMFGRFLDNFDTNDELRANTALIVTADHATFPDNLYKATFERNISCQFCLLERIPLILYADGVKAKRVDAGGKNSLDFAPTLLQWVRINKAHNYFLGCSLYDKKCAYPFEYVYVEGEAFYYTKGEQLRSENAKDYDIMKKIRGFYALSEHNERE
ncbi:MAG: LTA synthase family protein [Alphaproteobacteria bacterium]|nr:LTA synthase family protein [Alphaproteobacteria bacterium]